MPFVRSNGYFSCLRNTTPQRLLFLGVMGGESREALALKKTHILGEDPQLQGLEEVEPRGVSGLRSPIPWNDFPCRQGSSC